MKDPTLTEELILMAATLASVAIVVATVWVMIQAPVLLVIVALGTVLMLGILKILAIGARG